MRWLRDHIAIILLNVAALALFSAYLLMLTTDLRRMTPPGMYRTIILSKFIFFTVPVYIHNLILVRLLLDKGKYLLYGITLAALLAVCVSLDLQVMKLYNKNPVPILYVVSGQMIDLITGTGVLLIYRYIKTRNDRQRVELLQRRSELSALRAQLDQHFLFNSLNTIYGYIQSDPKIASILTERFSRLLRYQLERSQLEKINLSEEIEFINSYLLLQELRFEKQTRVSFSCEGEGERLQIAPMLLIPFVENAFKHADLGAPGSHIDIDIALANDTLSMEIVNSIAPAKPDSQSSLQIGLRNAKNRLLLLYPDHQLQISRNMNTFLVNLKLTLQ